MLYWIKSIGLQKPAHLSVDKNLKPQDIMSFNIFSSCFILWFLIPGGFVNIRMNVSVWNS